MAVPFVTTPGGEDLAVLPRSDDEDLVDALAARDARSALQSGVEELLDGADVQALLDAPSPIAFWRERRGVDLPRFASALDRSSDEAAALDEGATRVPLDHDRRAAAVLRVAPDELMPTG